ncbi:MAG: class I SAM-dependent methyltransferase [Thermoplasmata archaeon]|nr:class I SAM-dependent methyltransferase [Thermoplasmata archaeon]
MAGRGAKKERLARTFDRSAALYERGRPGYPRSALRFIASNLGVGRGSVVVDLAAGTGKFTREIVRTGAAVVAIEPMAGMRREFRRRVPDVPIVEGTAEKIPLPSGSVDAVVVAQAFHWFRGRLALREIARVLRPGGLLVLVWNTRDDRYRWSRELTAIIEGAGGPRIYAAAHGGDTLWRRPFRRGASPFTGLKKRTFPHVQDAPPGTFLARALSVSLVAAQPPSVRRRVAREVRTLLATDPQTRGRELIRLTYRTELFWCRLRAPRRVRTI